MKKLVSILIPAYKAEKWIDLTIKSALAQTWASKEVIIVDDGSTDKTLEIAKTFECSFVKVVTQENQGAAAARNKAFSICQGDYIQWLDADDLIAPEKVAEQLKHPEAEDTDILLSSAFGDFFRRCEKAVFSPSLLWQDLAPADWMVTKFANNVWMNPAVWLVSRGLTEAAGPWNESLSLDDDGEYFSRLVARSGFVKFVPTAKSFYRQWSATSLSRASSDKACRSLLTSLRLSIGYLLSLEDSPRTRCAALYYLQLWIGYFYPDKGDLIKEAQGMAKYLGGSLRAPSLRPGYELIRHFLGWKIARSAMRGISTSKLWLARTLELLNVESGRYV